MTLSQQVPPSRISLRTVLLWCSPSLLGFALFLLSFPIDRVVPFWPHLSIAELFLYWFIFITPIATVVGMVVLLKHRRGFTTLPKAMAWVAIIFSMLANMFVILGMIG